MYRLSRRGPVFRASTLILTVLLVFLVAACDSPEEKEAQHFAKALAFVEAGDDAKAMVEFRNVMRLNPKNAEALYEVGLIHERGERWVQAFNTFQAAAAERPGYVDANLRIGTLALMSNEVAIAEKAAADILTADPGNPDGQVLDAAVMLRRGDLERAYTTAETVLAADPRHEKAIAVVAGVLQARGRPEEALARIDQALALMPENIALRAFKIALFEQTGDVDGARRVFDELLVLEPENITHRLALSGFLEQQANFAGAEALLRAGIDEGLGTWKLGEALVALVYRVQGAEAAQIELGRLIERQPEETRFRFALAEILTEEERTAEAEATLQAIVEIGDEEAGQDAKTAIARLRLAAEDRDGARTIADEVLAENRDHRGANLIRGVIHLLDGNPDETIRNARTALRRDPTWTPGLKLLAEAHLSMGEADLAIDALRETVNLDRTDSEAAEMLAMLLTERGDLDTALKVWDQLIESEHEPAEALRARAQIRLYQQNWTAAATDIARLLDIPAREIDAALLAGTLELARNRYEDSREWFGKALELRPDAGGPIVGIVRSYTAQGNTDAALTFLERHTTDQPDDAYAFAMKGELLVGRGDHEAAATAYEAAIRLRPEWSVPYRLLADMHRHHGGELQDAIAVYERGLEAMPEEPEILSDLADTLLRGREMLAAIAAYERLLTVQPENDTAANNYAALVADHAYSDPAALDRAMEVAQRFRTSTNGWFLDTLGWLHYRKGDYPVAATYLERAVARLPHDPQFRYHLGMALKAAGQTEPARLELERAVVEGADYDGLEEAKATLAAVEAEAAAAAGR